jgi:hypothetical protein
MIDMDSIGTGGPTERVPSRSAARPILLPVSGRMVLERQSDVVSEVSVSWK